MKHPHVTDVFTSFMVTILKCLYYTCEFIHLRLWTGLLLVVPFFGTVRMMVVTQLLVLIWYIVCASIISWNEL